MLELLSFSYWSDYWLWMQSNSILFFIFGGNWINHLNAYWPPTDFHHVRPHLAYNKHTKYHGPIGGGSNLDAGIGVVDNWYWKKKRRKGGKFWNLNPDCQLHVSQSALEESGNSYWNRTSEIKREWLYGEHTPIHWTLTRVKETKRETKRVRNQEPFLSCMEALVTNSSCRWEAEDTDLPRWAWSPSWSRHCTFAWTQSCQLFPIFARGGALCHQLSLVKPFESISSEIELNFPSCPSSINLRKSLARAILSKLKELTFELLISSKIWNEISNK